MKKKLFPVVLAALFILTGSLVFADDCAPCEKNVAKTKSAMPSGSNAVDPCAPCDEYSPCDYNACAPCYVPVKKHHRHRQSRYCGYQYSYCAPCAPVCVPCAPACAPCAPACVPCAPACAPCAPACAPCAPVCVPCCPPPCAPMISPCCDYGCGYNSWNNCCYSGCHKKFRGKKCHHRAFRGYYGGYTSCNPCCF